MSANEPAAMAAGRHAYRLYPDDDSLFLAMDRSV